ncbi:MAG: HesA/MoeB/ThiF family protein [Spirochaetes bacterium]|nr:HesA/MoeB/ThiF family protein [Spirochaetota bacterium]
MSGLSDRERERYTRQLVLPSWGEESQLRLKAATVFVAGAGGLGSAVVLYLAAAGVGCIRVCDRDTVELSNLNRQILHTERGMGMRKALSAKKGVARLNSEVRLVPLVAEMTVQNVGELAAGADILLDCLDNVPSRLVLNGLSVSAHLPLVHAGVRGLGGQLSFLRPPATACLACFMQEATVEDAAAAQSDPPPILGAVAGAMGCLQALEALKYLTGIGERAENRIVFLDGETMKVEEVEISKNPDCPVCGR